ncbi:hypothetical protein KAH55_12110 [bacterium]|nr:hypothetical protein [bacterium]
MKNHLKRHEFVLLCLNNADITTNYQAMTAHIDSCPQCRHQLQTVETLLYESYQESTAECDEYLNYMRNKVDISVLPDDFKKHLEECEQCAFIYNVCKKVPSPEELANEPMPITAEKLAKMDQIIRWTLKKENFKTIIHKTAVNAGEAIRNDLIELSVMLRPVPHPSAIRGNIADQKIIFTHQGGRLKLHTGQPNASVKLCAIFQDKIFEKLADTCGDVTFVNLIEDDYTIDIDGYEVTSIKKKSNSAHM